MQSTSMTIRRGAAGQHGPCRVLEAPLLLDRRLDGRLRARRIFWLLLGAWIINLFDLGFTLLAHEQGILIEMNPVATHLLLLGPLTIVAFKFGTLILGSAIVWRFRRLVLVEHCVWGYALLCAGLSYWWYQFYHQADSTFMMACLSTRILPEHVVILPPMP